MTTSVPVSYEYSGVRLTPSGGATILPLTTAKGEAIGYIDRTHISVWKSGDSFATAAELVRPADWDFDANGTSVVLSSPANGTDEYVLRRDTPLKTIIQFNAGALLPAEKLDRFRQITLFRDQEAQDYNLEFGVLIEAAESAAAAAESSADLAEISAANAQSAAQAATTAASNAQSTADTAVATANSAVSTANSAATAASNAITTAESADDKADQALGAVSSVLPSTEVPNVASIPASPAIGEVVDIRNSTGIESFTPLAGLPAGFVGDAGIQVKIAWNDGSATWEYLSYFPNDPDDRYLTLGSLPTASTSQQGIVRLEDGVASTSATRAATANAAKTAFDKGATAESAASAAQGTADTALSTANSAVSAASAAQSTADSAVSGLATKVNTSDKASTAEAQTGTNDTKWMTPAKVAEYAAANPRGVPVQGKVAAYTLAAGDTGTCISTNSNVTFPNGLPAGVTISVYNNSASNITIVQGSGATLYLASDASTGNRTLLPRGLATIQCVANGVAVILGGGLE